MAVPVLMYGSENWSLNRSDKREIEAAEMRFLRLIAVPVLMYTENLFPKMGTNQHRIPQREFKVLCFKPPDHEENYHNQDKYQTNVLLYPDLEGYVRAQKECRSLKIILQTLNFATSQTKFIMQSSRNNLGSYTFKINLPLFSTVFPSNSFCFSPEGLSLL